MSQQPKARPAPITLYLSTPCAVTTCHHAYNWHKSEGCEVETCECIAFATPAPAATEEPQR
ncbi:MULTISPECIES: hypothetical protein [Streptomyces]|uniref:Uncharacterized protein n=1 Tax=Streptomyces poriferorum TaxID=2798799 RepID=A0ABY9J2H5_9ACTN|nr:MULTISPECIES: hypothetical protein [unclassified Streptomyces]MDP5310443.1 hypothetical protein [Streptomyces sp. Alt4]WLQ60403.1 hypothetical protein P8A19_35490 [Streptomyces sp. Alt2]